MKKDDFPNIKNFRDLGGMPTADGHAVRPHCLLRGADLSRLSLEEGNRLRETYRLGRIYDLRFDNEVFKAPDRIPMGVVYKRCGAVVNRRDEYERQKGERLADYLRRLPDMESLYRAMISNEEYFSATREVVGETVRSAGPDCSVYIHCSEGKDRTGTAMVLLELLLGADRNTIVADYMASAPYFEPRNTLYEIFFTAATRDRTFTREFMKMFRPDPSLPEAVLDEIQQQYGSTEVFYREGIGLTDAEIRSFRSRVLT